MKRASRLELVVSLTLVTFIAPQAHAQELDFVRALFRDVHSVTLFGSWAELRGSQHLRTEPTQCLFRGICGGGAEILWDITPVDRGTHLELGFGASYLRGFSGRRLADPFDLRASVRSFPEFGAYVSGQILPTGIVVPYAGGTFGFSDMWNAQVYGADRKPISVEGRTFTYGLLAGIAIDAGWGGKAFLEGGYRARRFPSVEYHTSDPIPFSWPRSLDLSGWQFAAGWQFELKADKRPPSFEGVWVLTTVSSDELPATLSQHRNADGTSTRIEIQGGTVYADDGSYRLGLHQKTSTLDGLFRSIHVTITELRDVQSGRYRTAGNTISLEPAGDGKARVERLGDDIVVMEVV